MNEVSLCIVFGMVISGVVSWMKNVSLVKEHPKIIVAVISAGVAVAEAYMGDGGTHWVELLRCFLVQFSAAVATHETVTHKINEVTS